MAHRIRPCFRNARRGMQTRANTPRSLTFGGSTLRFRKRRHYRTTARKRPLPIRNRSRHVPGGLGCEAVREFWLSARV